MCSSDLDKGIILLLLYVDDMIITGDDLSGIQELKDFLLQQFEMKDLEHLSYFLGFEITHSTNGLYITQAKYASDFLSQAGLTNSKTVGFNAHLTSSGGGRGNYCLILLFTDDWLAAWFISQSLVQTSPMLFIR